RRGPPIGGEGGRDSYPGLPPLGVLAAPVGHCVGVVEDAAVFRVAAQGPAGPVRDVTQVAEQGALVPLLDLAVGLGLAPGGRAAVREMDGVAAGAADLLDRLALDVGDEVSATQDFQCALVAVEDEVGAGVAGPDRVAAPALPGDCLAAVELVADDVGVGRL